MFSRISKIILLFAVFLISVLPFNYGVITKTGATGLCLQVFAKETNLEEICKIEELEKSEKALSGEDYRILLEKCQEYYTQKSKEIEKDITKTQQEKKTLQNQIYVLGNKIKNLDYQIYQGNFMIKDLGFQIEDTQDSVDKTSLKIENSNQKLINILRTIYEEDQKSFVEILLSETRLSDFFDNLVYLEALGSKNQELLVNIKKMKAYLESQKKSLDEEKQDMESLVTIQTLQKQESAKTKKDREYFLKLTEKEYQEYLKEKKETEKSAAEIRERIFELIGVPKAPTFGEAYKLAKYVEGVTGVSPAFLLAILTQESNIGRNVGQCYLKNPKTGEGVIIRTGKKISRVMKPSRDVFPFLSICKELGRNVYGTPVSCPMSYGYGGAMGPAQFIPSTWMIYKDRVKKIIGRSADPWNIKDAFLASALYLADCGAAKQTYNNEWRAAMIYFSGTTRRTKYNGYGIYGDSVMELAADIQRDINIIKK